MNAMTMHEAQRLRDRIKDELSGAVTKLTRWGDGWMLMVNRRATVIPGQLKPPIYDGQWLFIYSEAEWEDKAPKRFGIKVSEVPDQGPDGIELGGAQVWMSQEPPTEAEAVELVVRELDAEVVEVIPNDGDDAGRKVPLKAPSVRRRATSQADRFSLIREIETTVERALDSRKSATAWIVRVLKAQGVKRLTDLTTKDLRELLKRAKAMDERRKRRISEVG